MSKLFLAALLIMAFAASGAATRGSSDKINVVYRENISGEWATYVFGPYCPSTMKMTMIEPKNTSDPIEIKCTYKESK